MSKTSTNTIRSFIDAIMTTFILSICFWNGNRLSIL